MKIGFTGIELPEGKIKYRDKTLEALTEKDKPKKVSPFFAEFIKDEFVQADAIVVPPDNILDVLILDMDKLETRLSRAPEETEKKLLEKCLEHLENETPLCEVEFNEDEETILQGIAPHSLKPMALVNEGTPVNDIIEKALEKAGYMFFYTSGPTESHAWLVKQGSDIVTCAGTIHSDLARGFIKGDVVSLEDYLNCHNFKECISKGISKLVDRDYIVQPNEVIEIRFSV
jgi:ribosome-binding ATPase YchF (GTP1/OBG family)